MKFSSMIGFRDSLLEYLNSEKQYCEDDIKAHQNLSNEEKEAVGYIILNASIEQHKGLEYSFHVDVNNTKLRPGDKVIVSSVSSKNKSEGTIIENGFENVSMYLSGSISENGKYNIEISEKVMLDSLINLLGGIQTGVPGERYLEILANLAMPQKSGMGALEFNQVMHLFPNQMYDTQETIYKKAIKRPSVYCIQGPPGTGKTDVLSNLATAYSSNGYEVLIISNTHQAVNNALNKVATKTDTSNIVKIGEELKATELTDSIIRAKTYRDYKCIRKKIKLKNSGDIVGMTLCAAIINLGLQRSGFQPTIVLVDEAGQMPLVQAAAIGTFGSGSIIFIGDDKQMPPIYHEKLAGNPLSVSIFSHLCKLYPDMKDRLNVTFRMNEEITNVVSKEFYEKDGVPLIASDFSRSRKLKLTNVETDNPKVKYILESNDSLIYVNPTNDNTFEDMNTDEAAFVAELISTACKNGLNSQDMAVITPYRRQVKAIREYVNKELKIEEMPLVDTVERLQGQDVDMIIISLCVSSANYFQANSSFLLNSNRLNVMISRAKKKVVFVASDIVSPFVKRLTIQKN